MAQFRTQLGMSWLGAMERGQTETLVPLLDRLDEREKLEIEAIDLALTSIETGSYGRCQGCGEAREALKK
jgi:RNA polymerase-binding transcription factor DksA